MRMVCVWFASALLAQSPAVRSPFQTVPEPAVAEALSFSAPVLDFQARDLIGKTWRAADLEGKWTVVQIWGTFCIPCRQEHPALQAFSNRLAGSVQVLTFSVDDDPGRVAAYMKEKGYTFPVIVDRDLELRLFSAEGGLPKTRVIGPDGRIAGQPTTWTFGRALLEVERAAKAK